jgi:succinate dehydrogenase/fumarate reductase cytochrome b subunit
LSQQDTSFVFVENRIMLTHAKGSRRDPAVKMMHYFSGILLAAFISLHLFNQLISLAGPDKHIGCMTAFRKVYRQPVVEALLLLAVVIQIATGIKLVFNRKKKTAAKKIQVYSGLYLAYFLLVHVSAVLYGRYIHLDTNFYYAGVGLNYYPATFYFIPYYFLAVAAIALHVAAIHFLKTGSKWSSYLIATGGIVVAALIITGYTNGFEWRSVPQVYQDFIRAFTG